MDTVAFSINDGVAELTLNRPKQLNALNREMISQLNEIMRDVENDGGVRCVIISGGGDHFMAGGDITFFHELLERDLESRVAELRDLISAVHEFVARSARLPAPVIASVRGAAAGFGISLVAGCDLAIASDNAKFTSAYNFLGTSPDGGSTYYMPRTMGMKKAMELLLLSERFDAQAALRLGLVNAVVEDSRLEESVSRMARTIAAFSPAAVAGTKRLVRQSYSSSLHEQLDLELESFLACVDEDFTEGVRAFMEKRKPDFSA